MGMTYQGITETPPRTGRMLGIYEVALSSHLGDGVHKVLATVDYRDRTEWVVGAYNGHSGKFRPDRAFDFEAMALTVYADYDGGYTLRDGSKALPEKEPSCEKCGGNWLTESGLDPDNSDRVKCIDCGWWFVPKAVDRG